MLMRTMGIKGLICFISGMAVMTALTIHPKTSFIIITLVEMVQGDKSLIQFMKGEKKNEKEEEWIEVERE